MKLLNAGVSSAGCCLLLFCSAKLLQDEGICWQVVMATRVPFDLQKEVFCCSRMKRTIGGWTLSRLTCRRVFFSRLARRAQASLRRHGELGPERLRGAEDPAGRRGVVLLVSDGAHHGGRPRDLSPGRSTRPRRQEVRPKGSEGQNKTPYRLLRGRSLVLMHHASW